MRRTRSFALAVCLASLGAAGLAAPALGDEELEWRWSLTPILQYRHVDHQEDDDDVTGFFDQYEFVPNKGSDLPIELGLRDAAIDLFGGQQTPLLQLRLDSPTSNLGLSGSSGFSDPFFNQRALLLGHYGGLDLDLRYRRLRTEELRLFPNTAGGALVFQDVSDHDDRFSRERTGFLGELNTSVGELLGERGGSIDDMLGPRLSLRGGYEVREGKRQRRFLIEPSNDWLGLAQRVDQEVGDVGGGLLLTPWRLLTLTMDVDHERFRNERDALLRGDLGAGPPLDGTIGFLPDTDRLTGTLMLRSRIGERAVIEGGFQASHLEQVEDDTPRQRAAGLDDNSVLHTSANVSADVTLVGPLSANAFFKYDQRDNDIDRDTLLFNAANGSQVAEFVRRWERLFAGVEAVYRFNAANRLALGARFESVDRELDFALPGFLRILPQNALVSDDSESYTVYGRGHLRLAPAVHLNGEVGYRDAPETGYVTELDDYVYGKLRASYTLPLERAVVLSLFGQGGSGENRDQSLVSGVGNAPAGPSLRKDFDRTSWLWGMTANAAPIDRLGLFVSFFMSQDAQDYDLVLSSLQRYNQPFVPVVFSNAGSSDYEDERLSVVLGGHVQLGERSDLSASYAFTRAEASFDSGGSIQTALIDLNREIDSDTHVVDLELGHWLRDGLRVLVGYRMQHYEDDTRLPTSVASVVSPFELDNTQHTVTFGVTLTSELIED